MSLDAATLYLPLKWLHVLSSTVLFGTGIGTAFHLWSAWRSRDAQRLYGAARSTVLADWLFTATSGVLQPVSGAALVWAAGYDYAAPWLLVTYALYVLAALCWLPVVAIQIRVRDGLAGQQVIPDAVERDMRRWFLLGWPAFLALTLIFWLMVARPA
ncbi:MAG: Integral rane protein [Rhodospirillales bacterium]|nr:Integral rane protein [Rhodospirillales bacterium]